MIMRQWNLSIEYLKQNISIGGPLSLLSKLLQTYESGLITTISESGIVL
ncbi:MAG: hypothetical protein H6Q66_2988 [Firmicutes bacterium]|nr:hypothetical protein [Bacillota bacterium]